MSLAPANPVTVAELEAGLPGVLAAPCDGGTVRLLCSRPEPNARSFPEVIRLSRNGWVEGDFERDRPWLVLPDGAPDPRIQVAVLSWRVLDLVWRERERVTYPGDTIAADMNLTEENLPAGTLLSAGTALLRVSDVPNDGCAKWKVRCGRAAHDWTTSPAHAPLRLRGLFCSIVQDGEIRLGDQLRKV